MIKTNFEPGLKPASVSGDSGAGPVQFPSFDRVFTVRALWVGPKRVHRFERSFTQLDRAEKFMHWLLANTAHQDVRIENDLGQVCTFVGNALEKSA